MTILAVLFYGALLYLLLLGIARAARLSVRGMVAAICYRRDLDFTRRNYRWMRDGRDARRMPEDRYGDDGARR